MTRSTETLSSLATAVRWGVQAGGNRHEEGETLSACTGGISEEKAWTGAAVMEVGAG